MVLRCRLAPDAVCVSVAVLVGTVRAEKLRDVGCGEQCAEPNDDEDQPGEAVHRRTIIAAAVQVMTVAKISRMTIGCLHGVNDCCGAR